MVARTADFRSGPGDYDRDLETGYIDVGDGCWRRHVLETF